MVFHFICTAIESDFEIIECQSGNEKKIYRNINSIVCLTHGILKDFSLAHFERMPNKIAGENRLKWAA